MANSGLKGWTSLKDFGMTSLRITGKSGEPLTER